MSIPQRWHRHGLRKWIPLKEFFMSYWLRYMYTLNYIEESKDQKQKAEETRKRRKDNQTRASYKFNISSSSTFSSFLDPSYLTTYIFPYTILLIKSTTKIFRIRPLRSLDLNSVWTRSYSCVSRRCWGTLSGPANVPLALHSSTLYRKRFSKTW